MLDKLTLEYEIGNFSGRVQLEIIGGEPALSIEHDESGDYAIINLERDEAERMRDWLTQYLNEP